MVSVLTQKCIKWVFYTSLDFKTLLNKYRTSHINSSMEASTHNFICSPTHHSFSWNKYFQFLSMISLDGPAAALKIPPAFLFSSFCSFLSCLFYIAWALRLRSVSVALMLSLSPLSHVFLNHFIFLFLLLPVMSLFKAWTLRLFLLLCYFVFLPWAMYFWIVIFITTSKPACVSSVRLSVCLSISTLPQCTAPEVSNADINVLSFCCKTNILCLESYSMWLRT